MSRSTYCGMIVALVCAGAVAAEPGRGTIASPDQLVAGLPENARPRNHEDTVRCDRANDWLKENVVGRQIEWEYLFAKVTLTRMEGTRNYSIVLSPSLEEKENINLRPLHGVPWVVVLGGPENFRSIELSDMDEDSAEVFSGFKGKPVKVTATIKKAHFEAPALCVVATDFTIGGVSTGVPRMLLRVKSPDAATRKAAIEGLGRSGAPTPEAVAAIVACVKDADEAVRQAAEMALLRLEPSHPAVAHRISDKASVNGKYSKLLRVMRVEKDKTSWGEFNDAGRFESMRYYAGETNLPAGYWVYVFPDWYLWGEVKNKKP